MSERPGRESRRLQQRVKLAQQRSEQMVEKVLFLAAATLMVVVTLGHYLSASLLATWLATLILITVAEVRLSKRILESGFPPARIISTTNILNTGTVAVGLNWGLMGLYIITQVQFYEQVLLVMLMSCLMIFTTAQISTHFGSFVLYISSLVGPVAVGLVNCTGFEPRLLGGLLIVLSLAVLTVGWRHYQLLCHAIRAEIEAEEMNGVLQQLNAKLASIADEAS